MTPHKGGTRWVSYKEIPKDTWNMPQWGQTIFPQDTNCNFELSKLKLTMHWPLLYREQPVRKIRWVIKLQNHRNRENGNTWRAVFVEVMHLKPFLLILISIFSFSQMYGKLHMLYNQKCPKLNHLAASSNNSVPTLQQITPLHTWGPAPDCHLQLPWLPEELRALSYSRLNQAGSTCQWAQYSQQSGCWREAGHQLIKSSSIVWSPASFTIV